MHVVNIVRLRGPIACHRLACSGLSPSLCLIHAQTISPPHSKMRQSLVYTKGGSINYSTGILFQKVHSHLIVIPKAGVGITGRCIVNVRIFHPPNRFRTSNKPIILYSVYSQSANSHCDPLMEVNIKWPSSFSIRVLFNIGCSLIFSTKHYLRHEEADIRSGMEYKQTYKQIHKQAPRTASLSNSFCILQFFLSLSFYFSLNKTVWCLWGKALILIRPDLRIT